MAFALSAAFAYPQLISVPTGPLRGLQVIELRITATAADVDLDIGDLAGTFWTEAGASAMGAAVLEKITSLYPRFSTVGTVEIQSPQLLDRIQIGTVAGAGEYSVAINSTTLLPEIAVNAADGELVWVIRMITELNYNDPYGATWSYSS